jgi:hypothetical protein
MEGK